jgi:hypothetical protein
MKPYNSNLEFSEDLRIKLSAKTIECLWEGITFSDSGMLSVSGIIIQWERRRHDGLMTNFINIIEPETKRG